MTTALSTLSEMPTGKAEVIRFSQMLKKEILENSKDPLEIFVQMKYVEKTISDVLKDKEVKDHFVKEFDLYGKERVVEKNGGKLNTQEVGVKYDYSASGDPIWNDLEKQITELTEKRKARETFLKAIPDEGTVDPTTGVYITRPPKSSETQIICKFF